jgi:hypothetical protein
MTWLLPINNAAARLPRGYRRYMSDPQQGLTWA